MYHLIVATQDSGHVYQLTFHNMHAAQGAQEKLLRQFSLKTMLIEDVEIPAVTQSPK